MVGNLQILNVSPNAVPFWLNAGTTDWSAAPCLGKAMSSIASDIIMVEEAPGTPQVAMTTQRFAQKAKDAQEAEDTVQRALVFGEMEVDYDGDEEAPASKAFVDNTARGARQHHPPQRLGPTELRGKPGAHGGSKADGPLRDVGHRELDEHGEVHRGARRWSHDCCPKYRPNELAP